MSNFTEGFVTTTILYTVGALAIIGSIDEGLTGDRSVLITKSVLDGVGSIAFASTYGLGALFSAAPVLLYQGSITFLASSAQSFFTELMIAQLTAVGGLLIVGIAINLLEIKKVSVTNMLPAIVIAVLLAVL